MRKPRRGATLLELLVALVLLDLALLSLAAMGAVAAKRVGDAARRSRAVAAASDRLERLSARPCGMMSGGTARLEPGVIETWDARPLARAMELSDSIEISSRPPERLVLRRRVPCA